MSYYFELQHAQQADMLYSRGLIGSPTEHDHYVHNTTEVNASGQTVARYVFRDGTYMYEVLGPGYTEIYDASGTTLRKA